jgi:hypothetical protein
LKVGREAEDRHDLRGHGDVETRLPRKAVRDAAERGHDVPQRPVVHVHHPPPCDAPRVDVERVAPVDVVVDHRGEQVVRRRDRVEIAGEMEVHLLHRHDLRIAAAGRTALHPEVGAERGLADADDRLLADPVQPVAKTHGRRRLALARGGRVDRGHEHSLPRFRPSSPAMKDWLTFALSCP